MQITYFNESNYGELCGWWDKHQHAIIPYSSLPIGVVVSKEDKNLAMAFIYTMDGTDFAQISWTACNPENTPRQSYHSMDLAIDGLLKVAEKKNKKLILCVSSSSGVTKIVNRKNLTGSKTHFVSAGSL